MNVSLDHGCGIFVEVEQIIYDYFDYREYLNDIFNHYKVVDPAYFPSQFFIEARIFNPIYLLRVLRGERNYTRNMLPIFRTLFTDHVDNHKVLCAMVLRDHELIYQ